MVQGVQHYDVIIAGGGMVGASLACALSGQGLRIAQVEPVTHVERAQPDYDDRAIALAWGTTRIFTGLGLWERLQPDATPIHAIHVSDRGHPGMVHMDRDSEGLPAIGYVVPARVLDDVLTRAAAALPDVRQFRPARVRGFRVDGDGLELEVMQQDASHTLHTRLLVAADGADSKLREQAGIGADVTDYRQSAIVTNVTPQLPHRNRAWERFTDQGPIALLPMSEGRCGVVWTVAADRVDAVLAMSDADFLAALQERFGQRLGTLRQVGRRQSWPLRLVSARACTAPRMALAGNAVHTLHPIAGQGFNLGARDVAALAEVVVDAQRAGEDLGGPDVLARYAAWRRRDHVNVTVFTDSLARLFMISLPGLPVLRGVAMLGFDLLPPARRLLTRLTMGRSGRTPRLLRGVPL